MEARLNRLEIQAHRAGRSPMHIEARAARILPPSVSQARLCQILIDHLHQCRSLDLKDIAGYLVDPAIFPTTQLHLSALEYLQVDHTGTWLRDMIIGAVEAPKLRAINLARINTSPKDVPRS